MSSGFVKSEEAWGRVAGDKTVAVGAVGSCRALGATSDTGVLFQEQQEALEDFGQGCDLLSRTFHTHLSGRIRRGSFRWAEGDTGR